MRGSQQSMNGPKEVSGVKNGLGVLVHNWIDFFGFVKANSMMAGCIAILFGLIYGGQAFSDYYYIDKELLINNPGWLYNWGEIGRFGLVSMKKLLHMSWYNPYFSGVLQIIILWMTAMAAAYLFHMLDPRIGTIKLTVFALLFLVYPTYAEQFLFQFQAFEVVLAIFFLLVSDWYLIQTVREKNRMCFVAAVPCTIISFGIYQNMVPVQLTFYLGMFLILAYVQKKRILVSYIKYAAAHFGISFCTYELIAKIFFSGSGYLTDQIVWKRGTVRLIYEYYKTIIQPDGIYYTLAYDVGVIIFLIALLLLFLRLKRKVVWYLCGGIGVMLSPLFLALVMGVPTVARAQMMLPLADGMMWLFGTHVICTELKEYWRKYFCVLLVSLGVVAIFCNTSSLMRLFYTRHVVGRSDDMAAVMIVERLGEIPSAYSGKPLIFIGHRKASVNQACYQPEEFATYVSMSAFELDYMGEPEYFFSSRRIIGYLQTLGFEQFEYPTVEMMKTAYIDCEDMPVWPEAGAIKEFEKYIIIKLSEM